MGENSGIEWTHHTFNPWLGCVKVSPACANCYAEKNRAVAAAEARVGKTLWGPDAERVRTSESYWRQPHRWNREALAAGERRRVFCASLADVFEDRPDLEPHRFDLWRLIEETPGLDWLLLTKRPDRVLASVPMAWRTGFPGNVWLGTTVEDQARADERIPHLMRVPARVRFVSGEPLLEGVVLPSFIRLRRPVAGDVVWLDDHKVAAIGGGGFVAADAGTHRVYLNPNGARSVAVPCGVCAGKGCPGDPYPCEGGRVMLGIKPDECEDLGLGIDWLIVGGESGPKARPMHPGWARALRDQCVAAGVAFHFKQWGEWQAGSAPGRDPERERIMLNDGRLLRAAGDLMPAERFAKSWGPAGYDANIMTLVGKKTAGRELDGRTWDELPGASS